MIFLKDIPQKHYDVLKNRPNGSILIEILISILLLGIIVIGSFYSYSLVHHRILAQREQRNSLGVMQGWMEEATAYLLDANNVDPNTVVTQQQLSGFENELEGRFLMKVPNVFARGMTVVPDVTLGLVDSRIVWIRLKVTIDGLPTALYSEVYARKIEQK